MIGSPQRSLHLRADRVWCGVPGRGHAEREPLRRSYPCGSRGAGNRCHKQANKGGSSGSEGRGTVLGGRRVSAERFQEIGAAARQTFHVQTAKRRAQVLPVIQEIRGQGISTLRAIAAELNIRTVDAPRGGQWSAVQVQRVLNGRALVHEPC